MFTQGVESLRQQFIDIVERAAFELLLDQGFQFRLLNLDGQSFTLREALRRSASLKRSFAQPSVCHEVLCMRGY